MQIIHAATLSLIALFTQTALAQAPSPTFSINPAEVSLTTKGAFCPRRPNSRWLWSRVDC
jgi:hypothetical protein